MDKKVFSTIQRLNGKKNVFYNHEWKSHTCRNSSREQLRKIHDQKLNLAGSNPTQKKPIHIYPLEKLSKVPKYHN